MREEELLEEIPIAEEDLINAFKLVDELARRGELEKLLEASLERVTVEVEQVARELERIGSKLLPRVGELDLEAMAGTVFGALDPLGQLQAWLADQLKALASWFASIAQGVVSNLWSTLIKPAIDSLSYVVTGLREGIATVSSTVSSIASRISDTLSKLGEVASAVNEVAKRIVDSVAGLRDYLSSALAGAVSSISQVVQSISTGLKSVIDALAKVPDAVKSIVSGAADAIVKTVSSAISGLGDAVKSGLSSLASTVADFFGKIGSALAGLADQVVKGFSALGATVGNIVETVKGLWSTIGKAFESMQAWLGKALAALGEQVTGALKGFASAITDFFGKVASAISSLSEMVTKGFTGLHEALRGGLSDLWSSVQSAFTALQRALQPVFEAVSEGFAEMGRWLAQAGKALEQVGVAIMGFVNAVLQLPERISGFFKWIADAVEGVKQALLGFFRDPIGAIRSALEKIGEWIWNALPDWLKNAIGAVQGFFAWLWERLQEFAKDPLGFIYNAFKWIGEEIWKRLPEPLKWIIENVQKALAAAWDALVKFFTKDLPGFFAWLWERVQEFWRDPIGTIARGLYWVGEQIWKLLPEPLRNFLIAARKGLEWVWERLVELAKDPLGTLWKWLTELGKWIVSGVQAFASAVWGALTGFFQFLTKLTANFASTLYNAIEAPLRAIAAAITGAFTSFLGWAVGLGSGMREAVMGVLKGIVDSVMKATMDDMAELIGMAVSEKKAGEADILAWTMLTALGASAIFEVVGRAAKSASHLLKGKRLGWYTTVEVSPEGVGGKQTMHYGLYISPGKIFYELGDYLCNRAGDIAASIIDLIPRGFALAMEPAFMYALRGLLDARGLGDLPVSPPALPLIITAAQRMGIVEVPVKPEVRTRTVVVRGMRYQVPEFVWPEVVRRVADYLMYRAYPQWFRGAVLGVDEKGNQITITVYDRFRNPVVIPLGMIYEMPTPSELAEMMVRDAFETYKDYEKWAKRLGMHENVARFFYFLRFRYPSPDVLWRFAMRAASSMLWYVPTEEEWEMVKKDVEAAKAYIPVAPVELNKKVKTAFKMLTTFLKWQDYASFAWDEGWSSDAWVIADVTADIPSKLDARWLVRFGVTDWLRKIGVTAETTPREMVEKALSDRPGSELMMDVRVLCKLLQATGLHPYYVPLSAAAEAMSAVVDERTLIRAGLIDLYERGLTDQSTLASLLEDMGIVTFAVSYFDMEAGGWRDGYVNVPLTFLPAERRLITMKAEIDRHLDVYGRLLTEAARGVRELALKPEEAKSMLLDFAKVVADRLSASMKSVIGREVVFTPDSLYYDLWIRYAALTADIETTYRLRLLAQRVLGWVIYRVATGQVTDEELEQVIGALLAYFRFTEREAEAVRVLARAVNRIAAAEPRRRVASEEAIPTLGTLASMAEYIEVPVDYVMQVLAERRVEKTYAELWLKYVAARSIASEVNTLTSTFRRIVEYFGLPAALEKQVKELMRAGGWTERELAIFDLDLSLRRAYRILSTLVPTIRQFMGDALYLDEWEKLFDDLLKARGLDVEKYKAQVEYYKKLIKHRKIWRRINSYITELINCYERRLLSEQTMREALEGLKEYGLDEDEIEIIMEIANLRRARRKARVEEEEETLRRRLLIYGPYYYIYYGRYA